MVVRAVSTDDAEHCIVSWTSANRLVEDDLALTVVFVQIWPEDTSTLLVLDTFE